MPMFDYKCPSCGAERIDVLAPTSQRTIPCDSLMCGDLMTRAWLTKAPSAIGDEIDVTIRHGMCNLDGTPRRFRSKQELARATKERGLINRVEHVGRGGGDRSKHTSRWI